MTDAENLDLQEIHDQLEQEVERRERLSADVQRLQGKLESARTNLENVEQECRNRKVDPAKIDDVIRKLQKRYVEAVEEVKRENDATSEQLRPYLNAPTGENQ